MDRLSTPRIFGYDRSSTFVVDIVPSNVESNTDIIHSPVKTMIIFALQLYIGAELSEEIIGEESAPKGVNQPPSRVHRNFRTNDRHLPFTSEEVDFHLLLSPSPSSSFLFLERSHEEFQVWGEVGRMRWKVVGPRMD